MFNQTSQKLPFIVFLLFSLVSLTVFTSCESENKEKLVDVPELIQRGTKIQVGKEWDQAQSFYALQKKQLQENPNNPDAKLNLAQLYIREARVTGEHGHYYPAALQMCKEILQEENLSKDLEFRTYMIKAGVQLSLHEFAMALETGKKALALNDQNAQIHGVLVDAYVELGDYENAVSHSDKMISIKPDLRSYSRISYLREIHGDVEGAKKAMKLAVDAGYPGYDETAWTMLTLGDLYKQYGESDKAKIIYETILTERENYPFAIAAIADVHYSMGDLETAEKMVKEAINIIPEIGYYVQLAHIYKDQGRTEELDKIKPEIFAMLADDEASGHNMNLEYVDIYKTLFVDKEKAMSYALTEYKKRPNNIDVNRVLASVYILQDNSEYAKKHLEMASKTNNQHPDLLAMKTTIK